LKKTRKEIERTKFEFAEEEAILPTTNPLLKAGRSALFMVSSFTG